MEDQNLDAVGIPYLSSECKPSWKTFSACDSAGDGSSDVVISDVGELDPSGTEG